MFEMPMLRSSIRASSKTWPDQAFYERNALLLLWFVLASRLFLLESAYTPVDKNVARGAVCLFLQAQQ